ncbi:MAG: FHA domain-containing protein [Myxococcales bacterium]|nr:FHA domain-containing protein [Myxococcales bacterium]
MPMASQSATGQYLGIRLTVQSDIPQDPFYVPKDYFPSEGSEGIRIGRAKDCEVSLPDTGISGLHCRLKNSPNGFFVEDMGSRNGTFLSGRALAQAEQAILRDGDIIDIHPYRITVHLGASVFRPTTQAPQDGMESTRDLGQDMLQNLLTGEDTSAPTLLWLNSPQGKKQFVLKEYEDFTIGRGESCTLSLGDDAISREHASIRRDWTGVTIRDMDSRNGVIVNGLMIRKGSEQELKHNDRIVLGPYQFIFHDPFAVEMADKMSSLPAHLRGDDDSTLPPTAMNSGSFATMPLSDEPISGQWAAPKRAAAPPPAAPARRSTGASPAFQPSTPPPSASIPKPSSPPPAARPTPAPEPPPAPAPEPVAIPVVAPPAPPGLRPAQRIFLWMGGFLLALLLGVLAFLLFLAP